GNALAPDSIEGGARGTITRSQAPQPMGAVPMTTSSNQSVSGCTTAPQSFAQKPKEVLAPAARVALKLAPVKTQLPPLVACIAFHTFVIVPFADSVAVHATDDVAPLVTVTLSQ